MRHLERIALVAAGMVLAASYSTRGYGGNVAAGNSGGGVQFANATSMKYFVGSGAVCRNLDAGGK